ncbi:MAG: DUF1731 domain-containing protein [Bacteroidetes bacterium]|jgi:uncharacterized protein (TIGR01777 family)|nr:DUF1731 domain-containing protein [Bacteroidota bacterium]
MNIAIAGYNGYIGSHVSEHLMDKGHIIYNIGREALADSDKLANILSNVDVVCCFTGYPIIKRWTEKNKKRMYDSRSGVIQQIKHVLKERKINLKLFISASAIGIYDTENFSNENSKVHKKDFVTDLIERWEDDELNHYANRVIYLRIGIVLGKNSGYEKKLKVPWRFGVSPVFNKGWSNFCYIHIHELVRIIAFCIGNNKITGVINAVNAEIVKEYYFHDQIKRIIKLFLPNFLAKIVFGRASLLILDIPKVIPEKLIKNGFEF